MKIIELSYGYHSCAYCGSKATHIKNVELRDGLGFIDVEIHCERCGREDLDYIRCDDLLKFISDRNNGLGPRGGPDDVA